MTSGCSSAQSVLTWAVTYQTSGSLCVLVSFLSLALMSIMLGQDFPRMSGSFPRCWDGADVMEAKQLLWFCSGSVRLVRRTFLVCRILYNFCLIRRPWFKQGFGQCAAGTKCGPTDLPEGSYECPLWSGEPTQWVSTSLYESPFDISLQSSSQWSWCWKTSERPVRPGRSAFAANANAAQAATTSVTATLQTLELMSLLPGSCYPPFTRILGRAKT